jgi:hypothetical protein
MIGPGVVGGGVRAFEGRPPGALRLLESLLGAVTPNLRAVSLERVGPGVRLHFLLEREDSEDRKEIDDVAFELEALQERAVTVEVVVAVSTERDAVDLPGRRVFTRKEPAAPTRP